MRKQAGIVILAALGGAIASQAFASSLLGPRGEFSALFYSLEWKPGRACYKPMKPYSRERYALDAYKNDAIRYLECIKRAAENDAEYASDRVYEGYKKAADDFVDEATSRY